jgi:ABC-type multidrug transport system fused ATPase/permease subunit
VMNAHQIIVMEKWKIIQTGNHAKLLKQEWVYKTLVNLQNGIVRE